MTPKIKEREEWLEDSYHNLKHIPGTANALLLQMQKFKAKQQQPKVAKNNNSNTKKAKGSPKDAVDAAITYFTNNLKKSRMNYSESILTKEPIGSGVTEAACKTIVKQRLCQAGMRLKDKGASSVLSLRALIKSKGRWEQFWNRMNQYGFPITP